MFDEDGTLVRAIELDGELEIAVTLAEDAPVRRVDGTITVGPGEEEHQAIGLQLPVGEGQRVVVGQAQRGHRVAGGEARPNKTRSPARGSPSRAARVAG